MIVQTSICSFLLMSGKRRGAQAGSSEASLMLALKRNDDWFHKNLSLVLMWEKL